MEIPKTEILVTVAGRAHANFLFDPGEYVIGSGDGCHVLCRADDVERQHAKLTINFDGLLIEDLGSSSGTHVNGKRVREATRLWPNQKIQIGTATISTRRLKSGSSTDHSIAPQTAVIRRVLPEEFLRDRKYEIGGVVAQGGMGAILDAREATTARTVAMKVMLDTNSPEVLMRFVTEAKITAQLEHPGIVPVYELSVDENDQVFYTMKFVRGVTLRNIVDSLAAKDAATLAKYPLVQLVTIFQKVCDAIAFAHSKGIIHRDLKPENVMIGDYGEVLVMDWGLAKVLDPERSAAMLLPLQPIAPQGMPDDSACTLATMAGQILGTPQFMAPEQAAGLNEQLDQRSDIYSLGAILCQILTLRPPVEGRNIDEVLRKVSRGDIAWPATFTIGPKRLAHLPQGKVPDSLNAIVKKAMSLDADDRYQTVGALQADIVAYQNGFATSVEHTTAWKQMKLLVKRNLGASIAAAAGLILLAIASAVFTLRVVRERDRATAGELDARQQRDAANHERLKAEINAEAAQLVNLAQTDPEDALIRSVVNVEKCKRTLGEVTAPVAYGLTAALEHYRLLGTLPNGIGGKICAWAPTAKVLATFSKQARLVDIEKGTVRKETARFQDDPIELLAVTTDGQKIALAGTDSQLRLWDSADEKQTRIWSAHAEWVRAIAFSDDDRQLFSVGAEGSLKTWDFEGHEAAPETKLEMDGQKIGIAAIGDSGRVIVAGADSPLTTQAQIFLRETPSGTPRRITVTGHTSRITAAAVSPDGERIATADGDGTIRIWSREGKLVGGPSQVHRSPVEAVAFDASSDCVISRESDGTAIVSTTDGFVLHGPFSAGSGRNIACTEDGRLVASSQVLDLLGLESAPPLNIGASVLDLVRSQDGTLLAAIDDSATVRVWKLPSRELVSETVVAPGRGRFLSISPDNRIIAASLLAEETIHFIRTDGTKARAPLRLSDGEPIALRFHPASGRLFIATANGCVFSLDPAKDEAPLKIENFTAVNSQYPMSGALTTSLQAILVRQSGAGLVALTALSAEGATLAKAQKPDGVTQMPFSFPSFMDLSPDGERAFAIGENLLQTRSFPMLKLLGSFPVPSSRSLGTVSVASLLSERLAIGSGEGGVRILSTTGEPRSPWLIRDRKPVTALLADRARETLIATGREGRIRFWDTSEQRWMAQAARKLSQSQRIQRPASELDAEAARIVAANRTWTREIGIVPQRKSKRATAQQSASGQKSPGLTTGAGVPFVLKTPNEWIAVDALTVAFIDKLMRTMVFRDRGREVSVMAGFLPKDASIMQVTGGSDTPVIAITRLNGGTSPAELGVFAKRAKDLAENAMKVIGTLKLDTQTSLKGFHTTWSDEAKTAVITFEGKSNSGKQMLLRGYYIPTRQGAFVIGSKFVGDTAAQSLAELDRSVAAIRLPDALRVDAAFDKGFRAEIAAISAEEGTYMRLRERDRLQNEARALRRQEKIPEAAALMEKAAAITGDLVTKVPALAARWTYEQSQTLAEESGFFADGNRHEDALRVVETALRLAVEAEKILHTKEARYHLARTHARKAVSSAALKKFPDAATSYESAIRALREAAQLEKNAGHLRGAIDYSTKLAEVREAMNDTEGIAQTFEDAATDLIAMAKIAVKDAFDLFPPLQDRVRQKVGEEAAASMLRKTIPALIASADKPETDPDALIAGIRTIVHLAEKAEAAPGTGGLPMVDLTRNAQALGERLKAAGAPTPEGELWLGAVRNLGAPPRSSPIARDPKATALQLDLTGKYNGELDRATFGGDARFVLRSLPDGLQTFDGILFDVRGIIQASGSGLPKDITVPARIIGIAAQQGARRIHFLHGARYKEGQRDIQIGSYLLHYTDGTSAELPIVYGKDLRDWNTTSDLGELTPEARIAWTGYGGTNGIRLYHRAYENPHPDREIATIDLISAGKFSAPFIIAITIE